jgi:tetratricopeptide (TPR) repeat protein
VEDLSDRSILTSDLTAQTYFLPPLTAKFIRTRRPEAVTQTGDTLTDRAYAMVMEFGGDSNFKGYGILDNEWQLIFASFHHFLATQNNKRLQNICRALNKFFDFSGRWDEMLWLNRQAELQALASNDKESAGWRVFSQGWVYYWRNETELVFNCAKRMESYWDLGKANNKAAILRIYGLGYILKKDYEHASDALQETLEIRQRHLPQSKGVASALNELAEVKRICKDFITAEQFISEALSIAEHINYQEGIATYTGNLAVCALDQGNWIAGEDLAKKALELAKPINHLELIASNNHRLARALANQNRFEESISYIHSAVDIYSHLHHKDLSEAQETLAEIEKKIEENRE